MLGKSFLIRGRAPALPLLSAMEDGGGRQSAKAVQDAMMEFRKARAAFATVCADYCGRGAGGVGALLEAGALEVLVQPPLQVRRAHAPRMPVVTCASRRPVRRRGRAGCDATWSPRQSCLFVLCRPWTRPADSAEPWHRRRHIGYLRRV